MLDARLRVLPVVAVLMLATTFEAGAQAVKLGGRAFIDYYYQVSSPDADEEGLHGFTYRRVYLTADASLSEDFRSRVRLEANDGTTGAKGPEPYVKEMWIEWAYAGAHAATLGVLKPPAYDLAEDVWGYRSLEKMILDFQGINSSRDFGLRFDGPLAGDGTFRYAAMIANNSASKPETDVYKRAYGMISFHPSDAFVFYVSGDRAGYGDERESGSRMSAFGGYDGRAARAGVEVFWSDIKFVDAEVFTNRGVSLFGAVSVAPRVEVLARLDLNGEESGDTEIGETFLLAGVTYAPIENLRITPNLWLFDSDASGDLRTRARITVDLSF